jgi:hypothetical protein
MAIIYSYPAIEEISGGDLVLVSDSSKKNATKSATVDQLDSYINTGQATIIQVDDRVVTSASFNTNDGLLTLTRNSGDIPDVTVNLDNRYYLSSNPSNYTSNLGIVQSLTTTGNSGAATLTNGVLNIPQYSGGGSSAVDSVNSQTGVVVLTTSDLTNDSGYIEGTASTDPSTTAITEIITLTSAEYAAITPAADVMYIII